jgi:hypothetical protein
LKKHKEEKQKLMKEKSGKTHRRCGQMLFSGADWDYLEVTAGRRFS